MSWCVIYSARSNKDKCPSCLLATKMLLSLEDLKKVQEYQPVTVMFIILLSDSLSFESHASFFPLYCPNEHRIQWCTLF